jgi:RimJ/RimL family protein N-acetyltransferase
MRFPIRTERLELRPFAPADAAAMLLVYGDAEVMRYVGTVADAAETQRMLADYAEHQERHGFSFWAVVERASGEVIGDAGLYLLEGRGPQVEVGYTLGRRWWGRGYATEAAAACLAAAFGELGLEEVVAVADAANPASLRVLEKIGMVRSGSRTSHGHEQALFRAGR